ncbi:unnamed protein product [Clavelina lepadiformis]|uniref:Uncharacterized protein n=1 Tax=Clavelina lepadiformis TaxID=159417 RepID=A0ABP0FDH7_CLALP
MCVVRCLLICLPALFVGLSNGQGCQDEIDPIQCQNFQRSGYCSFGLFIPFMQENCAGTCGFNDCQPDFQCPEISITNGQVEFCTSGRDLDSSCSFTCDEDFGLSSTVDSVCIERNNVGTWSPPVPRCRACGAWEPVRDCSVTCGEGTVLERRECGSESKSRTVPCFEEECPADLQCPEISITNGQVEFCTSGRDLGSTCSFNCDEGFGLSSTGDRVCTDRNNRARWVPFPPRCEECEPWQPAGQCSMTCGEGMINEQRQCGRETESRTVSCFKPECPGGNSWDPWSGCSTTCGIGVETRSRSCGTGCTEYDDRECTNAQDCPCACNCVDGPGCGFVLSNPGYYCFFQQFQFGCPASCGLCPACQCGATYGDFGAWTDCTVSCGGGFQYRYRDCNKIAGCPGSHREERRCGGNACPGPAWSEWRNDGSCSEDCDGGIQNQVRDCINGPGCVGQSTRTRPCNMQACPEWGDWINDGDCSKDCGGGIQNQVRDCMNGPGCVGQSTRTRPCNAQACPEWGPWQNEGTCSETCGDGTITQTRTCLTGNDCVGETTQQVPCNEGPCPGANWSAWGSWSNCNRRCGPGTQTKRRTCPGNTCQGPSRLRRGCNLGFCTTGGIWSECSRSCGQGTRRRRSGLGGYEYQDCNNGNCSRDECRNPYFRRYGQRAHECCDAGSLTHGACGVNSLDKFLPRVIGGIDSQAKQWPWMVQVYPTQKLLCGGVLISEDLVLTAAHCLIDTTADKIEVHLGKHTFKDNANYVIIAEARWMRVHPQYSFPVHDIAVIKLKRPVNIQGVFIRPACLPLGENIPNDMTCVVAGWGSTRTGEGPASVLQQVEIRTLPFPICENAYRDSIPGKLTESGMICAGHLSGGLDSCTGDSGGPLLCQRCSSCAWMVAGITSFGDKNCGKRLFPGVYTRVVNYESWLSRVGVDVPSFSESTSCT